jgi:hypothetical protein
MGNVARKPKMEHMVPLLIMAQDTQEKKTKKNGFIKKAHLKYGTAPYNRWNDKVG